MSGKTIREPLAALGVVASLVFVGMEVRASTTQARAAAYQEIGVATAAVHLEIDEWMVRLSVEQSEPESVAAWTRLDWHKSFRNWLGISRIWETLQLQVEQGVIPSEALERLGYSNTANIAWSSIAFTCFWPAVRQNTSASLISLIETAAPPNRSDW